MKTLLLSSAAVAALGLASWALPTAPDDVNPGDVVDYTFRSSPLNSLGLSKLSDLRGRPVLVEFWGTR